MPAHGAAGFVLTAGFQTDTAGNTDLGIGDSQFFHAIILSSMGYQLQYSMNLAGEEGVLASAPVVRYNSVIEAHLGSALCRQLAKQYLKYCI
jgi:hypothetical protein